MTAAASGTTKTASAPIGTPAGDTVIYQMTAAIQNMTKTGEGFRKAVEGFHDIEKNAEMRILAKRRELQDLETARQQEDAELERTKKHKRLDMQQDLREFGYEYIKKMLGERNETALPVAELEAMKADLDHLKKTKEQTIVNVTAKEAERAEQKIAANLEMITLRHLAQTATLKAQNEQQEAQIKTLQQNVQALRDELNAQRELTKQVAYSQQATRYVQQPQESSSSKNRHD